MPTPVKIVFLGTPEFATPILASLAADKRFQILAVITQEDKPFGRKKTLNPSPIKKLALELNLPLFQPTKLNRDQELIEKINSWGIDFLVVVAYGQILSQKVLNLAKIKSINIHGSILPKYRGASPIEQSLLNADQECGVSIMEMTAKMDEGPVYSIHKIKIENSDDNPSLRHKLSLLSANVIGDVLIKIKNGEITPETQVEELATYCQKISKEDGHINPITESAQQIIGKLKAFKPWPGITYKIKDKNFKIIEAQLSNKAIAVGELLVENQKLLLGTISNSLEITKIQLEGKNPMNTNDFLRGNIKLFG